MNSMTAFGRARQTLGGKDITVEIKSVNNRYLDCNVRTPRNYAYLEEKIKPTLTASGISRGKVEVNISAVKNENAAALQINERALREYLSVLEKLRDEYHLRDDISVMRVAANPAIFAPEQEEQTDPDALWEQLLPALAEATDRFLAGRDAEGARLCADLRAKLDNLKVIVDRIEALAESNTKAYRQKLEERLRNVLEDKAISVDENRILTECAIFADKIAVDEEMVRLRSHFALFEEILDGNEPAGRKLDFLLQEINREVNTTGSKSCDSTVAHLVVQAKNELEKIREQVQNLE